MQCELCGKETLNLSKVKVESTPMNVCVDCKSLGKRPAAKVNKGFKKSNLETESIDVLKSNYSSLIKEQREKRGLTQAQLASKLGVKQGLIQSAENNAGSLSVALAKKIESFLGLSLYEKAVSEVDDSYKRKKSEDDTLTLGDMIKRK